MKLFSYDSKFSQILMKIGYSCCLNIMWFICCIPIVTIGASTTALYYVTLKLARDEETYIMSMFFRAFKENFKQSTILWLILMVFGGLLGTDAYILNHLRTTTTGATAVMWTLILALVIAAFLCYVIILVYVFPLVASVTNTNAAMLQNSFLIGIRYLFCTIVVVGIHVLMFVIIVRFFTPMIIFGEGLCALISSIFLSNVIQACSWDPNKTEEELTEGEEDEDGGDAEDGEEL